MKQTKRHKIRNRIFNLADLKRIAGVFAEQAKLATKLSQHNSVEYILYFADDYSVESDSPDILEDTYSEIKRPVNVEFRFINYKLDRKAIFSITHGESNYGNEFIITSKDLPWLNDIYTKLLDFINGTKPQSSWILKHSTLIYHIVAIGVGSFGMLVIDLIISTIMPSDFSISNNARDKVKAITEFISKFEAMFYILSWAWNWLAGWAWGAGSLTRWILSSWPNIELDFGADHLKLEKQRRKRIYLLLTIVIVPITISVILDIVKGAL